MLAPMKVFVTGATGFIGYHAARRLLHEGHAVHALVRSREKAERVLAPLGVDPQDFVVGDMTDPDAVARGLEGCDAVLHAAANVSVTSGPADFSENLRGTELVVGGACERGLDTLFVSSLIAIFDSRHPMRDDSPVTGGRTRYGRSKAECDAWVRARQAEGGPVAIVYPSGCVGPDDPGMSEAVRAYRGFLRGTLASEGGNQMVDARDLGALMVRMLEQRTPGRVVAGGHFHDWDAFTRLLEQVTGAEIRRIRAPGWLLRGAARGMDVFARWSGRTMPMTGEGVEIATLMRPVVSSDRVGELGITWRDPAETLRDLFQWFLDVGRLPPQAVPALRARPRAGVIGAALQPRAMQARSDGR
jgi:nucleoside-diphosphate-sugar epimerase